jgi:hypothetical protein
MTPEYINDLIKEIHNERKERGEWEDPCLYYTPASCESDESRQVRLNAYLAQKLDLITEAIVDAMRARRDLKCSAPWEENMYEDGLALAAIRTMDFMGFRGMEYLYLEMREIPVVLDAEWILRSCINSVCNMSRCFRPHSDITSELIHSTDALITGILDIAQLDNIDLSWHINARRESEKEPES